jgi:uncharacterized protein (TIGR03083 family)
MRSISDLGLPTRLDGWSVRVLLGHLQAGAEALWRWTGEDVSDRTELDAISYWDPAGQVAEGSSAWALDFAAKKSDEQIVGGLEQALQRGAEAISDASADAIIVPPIGPAWIRFDEFVVTRVLELTVHGLDLAAAANVSVEPDPNAVEITTAVLDARLGAGRPADLVDDIAWIEAATGRRPHGDERLPVIR